MQDSRQWERHEEYGTLRRLLELEREVRGRVTQRPHWHIGKVGSRWTLNIILKSLCSLLSNGGSLENFKKRDDIDPLTSKIQY